MSWNILKTTEQENESLVEKWSKTEALNRNINYPLMYEKLVNLVNKEMQNQKFQ